jgi:hypothetical protein
MSSRLKIKPPPGEKPYNFAFINSRPGKLCNENTPGFHL